MQTRYFALVLGIIFILVGVMGFIPALVTHDPAAAQHAGMTMQHGRLLGLFPVNTLHNLAHIAFGIWGVLAYGRWDSARFYARGVAILYGILAIAGLIPGLNTMFGYMPIDGNDVWLHALIALAAAYFGFATVRAADREPAPAHDTAITH